MVGKIAHNRFYRNIACGFFALFCLVPVSLFAENDLSDAELKQLNEAVEKIRSHALVIPKSTNGIADTIIRSFARSIDDYGDFLTAGEYTAFIESSNSDYFGVEMDIEKKDGRIYLYPFAGGQADKAGIHSKDELFAVNGKSVSGKSIFLVGSTIRGARGESVQLTVKNGKEGLKLFTLIREDTNYVSVRFYGSDTVDYICITRFVKNTAELLQKILKRNGKNSKPLIIDLRQNQGGSMRIARQCADFFLEPDTVLFHLKTRNGVQDILAESPVIYSSPVILVQDRNTASAAEVFIAALERNGRAITAGENSYGKGVAQRFIPLSDGSALRLTYAEILTPGKKPYNGKGLLPNVTLSAELLEQDLKQEQFAQNVLNVVKMNKK